MKKILSVLLALALGGCAFDNPFVRTEVVVQYKYVVRTALDQQKAKPPYAPNINVQTATQLDLANWIKLNEERQYRLEALIDELILYYEKPATAEKAEAPASSASSAK